MGQIMIKGANVAMTNVYLTCLQMSRTKLMLKIVCYICMATSLIY